MSNSFYDISRVGATQMIQEIRELKRRMCDLEDRLAKVEPEPEDSPDDLMLLEVLLKENYMRGYVTGKFEMIEDISKNTQHGRCKTRYNVRGYAYRKNVDFITTHASGVGMEPKLYRRHGE